MARWLALWASSGCNLAINAVLPSSDRGPVDSGGETGTGTDTDVEADDVLISEVMATGPVKFVELYNGTGGPIEMDNYELRRYANGATEPTPPTLELDGLVIRSEQTFVISGGSAPDGFSDAYPEVTAFLPAGSTIEGNGDDVYELVFASGGAVEVIDIYGVVGESGFDRPWSYQDGSAKREADVLSGRSSWRRNEWEIAGAESANPGVR